MQLDKDHKFNFFKKPEPRHKNGSNIVFAFGFITAMMVSIFFVYPQSQKIEQQTGFNVLTPKGAVMTGVLTAQNTFVNTAGPTFVIHPQTDSLGVSPSNNSFESLSQKEKLTHWVKGQEPGIYLTPDEVQKMVKLMTPINVKK